MTTQCIFSYAEVLTYVSYNDQDVIFITDTTRLHENEFFKRDSSMYFKSALTVCNFSNITKEHHVRLN